MKPIPLNLNHLFLASRVVTAVYRIVSTTLLLAYMARRVSEGRKIRRTSRRFDD